MESDDLAIVGQPERLAIESASCGEISARRDFTGSRYFHSLVAASEIVGHGSIVVGGHPLETSEPLA
jgi:hypothetical protein